MQGVELHQSFHVFDMGETDMVLGVEWLRSLGEVKVNWDELTMKLNIGNEERRIKGDPSLVKTLVSLKSIIRNLRKGGQGYMVEFGCMAVETVEETILREVQELIEQYPTMQEPVSGLPPRHVRDHAIEIK